MLPDEEFVDRLAEAYEHLYDIVYLRTHPLTKTFCHDPSLSSKEKAWRFHQLLLEIIKELDPGAAAPPFCREWRRHRLMALRYTDGLDSQIVADRLAISRRTYYRELRDALEATAGLLMDRLAELKSSDQLDDREHVEQVPTDRLELLRLEAARLAQARRHTLLGEVVESADQLIQELAKKRGIQIITTLHASWIPIGVDRNTMRQILLGTLSYLVENLGAREIHIRSESRDDGVLLWLEAHGGHSVHKISKESQGAASLSMLHELASIQRVQLERYATEEVSTGFKLVLPSVPPCTVMVVDDSEDAIRLFERYLTQHNYAVIAAQSGAEAVAKARDSQPFAITLDLMMPDQDGWDVLQNLANQPETQDIPVIVCTVLSAKELALSLGATGFLEKPVSEQALLSALEALEGN